MAGIFTILHYQLSQPTTTSILQWTIYEHKVSKLLHWGEMEMGINKSKVLIVMHGAGKGGVEKRMGVLCKYLDKGRFEAIVAMPEDGPLKANLEGIGVKTIITPLEWWTPIWFFYGERHYYKFLIGLKERVDNLVKIINENGINVVHTSTLPVIDGAIAAKAAGIPHIWHVGGRFEGTSANSFGTYLPIEVLYSIVNSLSAKIVVVSRVVRDFLSQYIPVANIEVIYNGTELDKFNGKTSQTGCLVEEFPNLSDKVLVGLVGRIARVKGIEDYVEAAIEVLKVRDDVGFLIVGPEEDKTLGQKVRKKVNSFRFADKIIFTGYREDIPVLLREIDLVVCSSLKEGFPNNCLEAMAASKAIVSTKCGGSEELIIHGETGYLVNVGRPDELAEAILSIIKDRERLKLMGIKGRESVEQFFSAQLYARNFEELYLRMMKALPVQHPDSCTWTELLMTLTSNIGALGTKMIEHDREIKELRNFEALFKDNFFYRTLRNCYKSFKNLSLF